MSYINNKTMSTLVRTTIAIVCLALQSCTIFYPVTKNKADTCELWSRELKLESDTIGPNEIGCNDEACLATYLAAVVVVPVSSFIVSGSIVLAGNSIHWLERQGKCDVSYIKQKIRELKELIGNEAKMCSGFTFAHGGCVGSSLTV
jgi:hypothetical protein